MKKIISLLLALTTTMVFTACSSSESEVSSDDVQNTVVSADVDTSNPFYGQTVKAGCSIAWVPYETAAADGSYEGMNIEIATKIVESLGGKIEFEGLKFTSLIGSVQSGHIDFTLGGMTPNAEREETLDFTVGYFYPKNAIIYDSSLEINELSDLAGYSISTSMGTGYQTIADSVEGATSNGVTNTQTAVQEILAGRTDACILDGGSAVEYVKENEGALEYTLLPKGDDHFTVGFPKESPYYETFNNALMEIMENGELDEIIAKYLSADFID